MSGTSLAAEQNRYGSWSAPDKQTAGFVEELRRLIDDAERARAADPHFLYDLRDLARRYDNPWQNRIFTDDFSDGNFTTNPTWTVASGNFGIGYSGLVSSVNTGTARQAQGQPQGRNDVTAEELAAIMIGRLLQKGMGQNQEQQQPAIESAASVAAEIYTRQNIPNVFALTAMVSGSGDSGGIDFAITQGTGRNGGYRLSISPGQGVTLYRLSPKGNTVIERSASTITVADGKEHLVGWSRDSAGSMAVRLDGVTLFSAVDRGYRDPFDSLSFGNRGGDYTLHTIALDGGQ
ncbi:MAG: hypothetical protein OQJ87_12610 [Rhodospirillales bacterium]|nr:hypothetical protein [Rhodospirillales bacterium]MCW9003544.1 hypothetical protein [Rhodospirillales bacterium]MCW9040873.1 hypothetical protein [Rhodospirillales bacterium]